jgi:putative ABC transport system permease protein
MMTVESVLVAAAGLVLGAAVATAALVPFSIALTGSLLPDGPVWMALAVIGSATVLTATAVLVSTAAALRSAPLRTSTA